MFHMSFSFKKVFRSRKVHSQVKVIFDTKVVSRKKSELLVAVKVNYAPR